nr:hypothetical protein [bacterium]
MENIVEWIRGVAVAAIAGGCVVALVNGKEGQQAVRWCAGLCVLYMLISPAVSLAKDWPREEITWQQPEYREGIGWTVRTMAQGIPGLETVGITVVLNGDGLPEKLVFTGDQAATAADRVAGETLAGIVGRLYALEGAPETEWRVEP